MKGRSSVKEKAEDAPRVIDCEAIQPLSEILDRLQGSKGDMGALLNWLGKEIQIEPVVYGKKSRSRATGTARLNRARQTLQELELASGLVTHLQSFLSEQLTLAKQKIDSVALRTYFLSLPDDTLANILELATRPTFDKWHREVEVKEEMRCIARAISLSHVCRKFRTLILKKPRIWNTISEHMVDIQKTKFCMQHSKEAPLEILFEQFGLRQSAAEFDQFFDTCLLFSRRWGSLTIGKSKYDPSWEPLLSPSDKDHISPQERRQEVDRNILAIGSKARIVTLPNLKQLTIDFIDITGQRHLSAEYYPFWRWVMPTLVELNLSGCPPPPANPSFSRTLKKFKMFSSADHAPLFNMIQLADFLSSCSAMDYVSLRFAHWKSATACPLRKITHVGKVHFSFVKCTPEAGSVICASIQFPEVSTLSLCIQSLLVKVDDQKAPSKFEALISRCFYAHPRVKSLHLGYYPRDFWYTPVVPPFTALPALESLSLDIQSWSELLFWKEGSPIPEDMRLPAIRKLSLDTFTIKDQWKDMSLWLEKFFAQLKKQGCLDTFERLELYQVADFTKPSDLKGAILDYLPIEKIWTNWQRYETY